LKVPASAGDSIRATAKITEALLESATDLKHTQGTDTTLGEQTEDLEMGGYYALQMQNIPDLASKGPSYWSDGTDDIITVADSSVYDVGTSDFSIVTSLSVNSPGGTSWLFSKLGSEVPGWNLYQVAGVLRFQLWDDANFDLVTGVTVTAGTIYNLAYVGDRDGYLTAYNGGNLTAQSSMSGFADTLSNAGNFTVGGYSTPSDYCSIGMSRFLLFNLVLSTAEVKALSSGAPVPYKYIGASQTVLTSGTLTIGKRYRIVDWISDDDFTNIGGTNEDGNEFTATGATPTKWLASSTVVQIGCVLQLEQDGITATKWYDKSGNDLDGTVSGAVATNLPETIVQTGDVVAEVDETKFSHKVPVVIDGTEYYMMLTQT